MFDISIVSTGSLTIFEQIFSTYRECERFDEDKFSGITYEKLLISLKRLIDRVEKHGKINPEYSKILMDIYSGQKTKKQIVGEQSYTYYQIQMMYKSFIDEAEWCYGDKNEWNMKYAEGFDKGEIRFCYSIDSLAKLSCNEKDEIIKSAKAVIEGQDILTKEQNAFLIYIIENDICPDDLSPKDKEKVMEYTKKILHYYKEEEKLFYNKEAEKLIENDTLDIHYIREYCKSRNLRLNKIVLHIEKKGKSVYRHHPCRRKRLQDYLE